MKKILFSCFAAILTVTVFSGFRKGIQQDDLYYFAVMPDRLPGDLVTPNDVLFMDYGSVPEYVCPEPINRSYICVIGVTVNHVTHINYTNLAEGVYGTTVATRTGL